MVFEISFTYFMHILNDYGISTLFGPFLVIFSLTYGLLRKANLFRNHDRLASMIAFGFSLYYIANIGTILFTQRFFAMFFYEMLVLLFVLMVIGILGGTSREAPESWRTTASGILGMTVLIAALYAYMANPSQTGSMSVDFLKMIYTILFNTGIIVFVILIVAFVILHKWITSTPNNNRNGDRPSTKDKVKNFFETFADIVSSIDKNNNNR